MRTVPHPDVVNYVAHKAGQIPVGPATLQNFQTADLYTILEFIDYRSREAWERFDWSDLINSDVRAFRDPYSSSITYSIGSTVYDNVTTFQYFISLVNSNIGHALPTTAPYVNIYWSVCPLVPPDYGYWQGTANNNPYVPPAWPASLPVPLIMGLYIDYNQLGQLSFDNCMGVYLDNPQQTLYPRPVSWLPSIRGVELPEFAGPSTVYMVYRQSYPGLGKVLYTDYTWTGTSADIGRIIYDPITGQSYKSLVVSPGSTFTNVTNWQLLQFPYVISEYVKTAAHCDWMVTDGQVDRAEIEYKRADLALANAFDKQESQQGLIRRFDVVGADHRDTVTGWH
jgi:hypothetical protein